jgi:DNA-binding response OmpR family regulator
MVFVRLRPARGTYPRNEVCVHPDVAESSSSALDKTPDLRVGTEELHTFSVVYGKLAIDWCSASVSTIDGSVTLLRTELRLLGALLETAGEPVRARVLIRSTWPDASYDLTRYATLHLYVRSLRRRLRVLGARGKLMTVPGVGYQLLL